MHPIRGISTLIALTALVFIAGPSALSAQAVPEVGDRVRITQRMSTAPLEAELTRYADGWLEATTERGTPVRLRLDDIDLLELGSERTNFVRHFLGAEAVGALLGSLIGGMSYQDELSFLVGVGSRSEAFFWGAWVGAVYALPIALIAGVFHKQDVWTPVDLGGGPGAERIRLHLAPSASGITLGARIPLGGGA